VHFGEDKITEYDAIVVGAGPAGSTSARIMARAGLEVLVIEKDQLRRDKPCAGAITIRTFDKLNIDYSDFVEREISGIRIYSPNNSVIGHDYGKTVGITVYRENFDSHLLQLAINAGAQVLTGTSARDIIRANNSREIIIENDSGDLRRVSGKMIIASDGVFSTISKKAGLYRYPRNLMGVCTQYEMQMKQEDIDEQFGDTLELYYGDSVAPGGYGWIFPKSRGVTVGVGFPVPKRKGRISDYLDFFVKNHPIAHHKLQNARIYRKTGGIVPMKGVVSETFSDNLIIVGDAAGHVSPISAEGIYYSMICAMNAANVTIEAVSENDFSKNKLKKYEKEWKKEIGMDLKRGLLLYNLFLSEDKRIEFLLNEAKFDKKLTVMIIDILIGAAPYDEIIKKNYGTLAPLIIKGLLKGVFF